MAADKQIYRMVLQGFWMDIGQPKDYIAGTGLYLQHVHRRTAWINDSVFLDGDMVRGDVLGVRETGV